MEHKKKKELRIRSCLTGAIWLALAFSMLISALLFAFLNHFLDLPGKIPGLGWLLIFNTLICDGPKIPHKGCSVYSAIKVLILSSGRFLIEAILGT